MNTGEWRQEESGQLRTLVSASQFEKSRAKIAPPNLCHDLFERHEDSSHSR